MAEASKVLHSSFERNLDSGKSSPFKIFLGEELCCQISQLDFFLKPEQLLSRKRKFSDELYFESLSSKAF